MVEKARETKMMAECSFKPQLVAKSKKPVVSSVQARTHSWERKRKEREAAQKARVE
jgi:hypothetical protein